MTLKTTLHVVLLCMISASAFAGYDFSVEAHGVSLSTTDGARVPGALFKYEVTVEKKNSTCEKDAASCWQPITLEASAIIADSNGSGTLPLEHFVDKAANMRPSSSQTLVMNYWAVLTPFKDQEGHAHQCVTLDNESLSKAGLTVEDNRKISASLAKVQKLLKTQLASCQQRVALTKSAGEKYVLPF